MARGGFRKVGLVTGAGLRRLRRLAVFDAAFVPEVATLLSLLLALGRFAALVQLFLDVAGGFLGFTFNAHCNLLIWRWINVRQSRPFLCAGHCEDAVGNYAAIRRSTGAVRYLSICACSRSGTAIAVWL